MSMNKRQPTLANTLAKSLAVVARIEQLHPELTKEIRSLTMNVVNDVVNRQEFAVRSEVISQAEIDGIYAGNKISAIKACRERTGKGLYDAKVYIENLIESNPAYKDAFYKARNAQGYTY